jgi:succinate dehydrogenase / fumarate reductase cytochrome b subunit
VPAFTCAPSFGKYEFIIRRLHSLTGLVPVGAYLAFHLATNASVLDGIGAYQYRVDQIHRLGETTIFFLEWPLIFLPLLFHGIIGVFIVCRGKRNVTDYPYIGNIRYTLQRLTGVLALLFVLYHVFQMHGWIRAEWWLRFARGIGGGRFRFENAITAADIIRSSVWIEAIYAIGVLASVYHLANGVWTMGITWGVWTSPRAQRSANYLAAAVGILLAVVGIGAFAGIITVKPETRPAGAQTSEPHPLGSSPIGLSRADIPLHP